MEEYNKIYPELLSKEPPKDGNAFRLQQSCRVIENLEKEAKHYASVRKKYKRCYNLLSRTSTLSGTLSFCLSGSGVGTAFSGVGLPLAASLGGPWSYLWSCECYHWRSWKKCFTESDETRKNCFCLRVKKLIA